MSETTLSAHPAKPGFEFDRGPALVTAVLFVLVGIGISQAVDLHQAVLYGLGGLLGISLYHASFGFTGGWRRFSVEKRGRAVRLEIRLLARLHR
mgnify:FL=1